MMRRILPSLICAAACQAQTVYTKVPYAFSSDRQAFTDVFARARTQPVRILLLGDSQETTPGGGGVVYVPRLNFEMWLRFGATPETPFMPAGSSTGAGPPADWLGRTTQTSPGPVYAPAPAGWLPPNISAWSYGASHYGTIFSLEHDASFTDPGVLCTGTFSFLSTTSVMMDVLTAGSSAGGDVAWRARANVSPEPMYFSATTSSGVFGISTVGPTSMAMLNTIGPISLAGQSYLHVELGGASDTNRATILGARFRSTGARGVTVSSFSQGGYLSSSFLNNHGDCGAVIAALGFDAVAMSYGANDAASGVSAAEFGATEAQIIAKLREWIPGVPVILLGDPFRYGITPTQQDQYDRYPGAQLDLATSLPGVMVLNGRRALEDLGWNAAGATTYLADQVHYNALGARTRAAAEAKLLEDYAFPCYADVDRSGTLNINDFIAFLNGFAAGDAYTNCDRSSSAPVLNVNDFTCFLGRFAAGCS